MYHVMLIICALGTQPSPRNATCVAVLFPDDGHETYEACWKGAGVLVTAIDPVLRARGLEAWRHNPTSCLTDEERETGAMQSAQR